MTNGIGKHDHSQDGSKKGEQNTPEQVQKPQATATVEVDVNAKRDEQS